MKKLFTLLFVALAAVATMNAADKLAYTITFNGNDSIGDEQSSKKLDLNAFFASGAAVQTWSDSRLFSEGLDKIDTTASSLSKIYNYMNTFGPKFNTAKVIGKAVLALKEDAQVNATKIVLTASAYITDFNNSTKMRGCFVVNGVSTDTINSLSNAQYEVALDGSKIDTITITTANLATSGTKVVRLNLKSIAVYESDNTSVEDAIAAKQVAAVRYYNLAGQQSAVPFEGVNVVKTEYTDGTTQVTKTIK